MKKIYIWLIIFVASITIFLLITNSETRTEIFNSLYKIPQSTQKAVETITANEPEIVTENCQKFVDNLIPETIILKKENKDWIWTENNKWKDGTPILNGPFGISKRSFGRYQFG